MAQVTSSTAVHDVVIIGSGAGGGMAAYQLATAGHGATVPTAFFMAADALLAAMAWADDLGVYSAAALARGRSEAGDPRPQHLRRVCGVREEGEPGGRHVGLHVREQVVVHLHHDPAARRHARRRRGPTRR